MLPVVHFIFVKFTFLQLLSPLLSVLFALFYPAAILLHLAGYGGILDSMLEPFMRMEPLRFSLEVSLEVLALYLLLSVAAIRNRALFYLYLAGVGGFCFMAADQVMAAW
jgi:competence protein ComEC